MEPWLTESSLSSCQRLWLGRVYTSSLCRSLLARMVGDHLPGHIMAAAEASELNHVQQMAGIALDVDLYAKPSETLEEEKVSGKRPWKC